MRYGVALGVFALFVGLGDAAAAESARRYDGYVVVRVEVTSESELAQLLDLAADVWSEHVGVGPLDLMFSVAQLAELDALGVRYHVWIPDVQALIDAERAVGPRGWFDDYHPYEDIVGYLNQLAAAHPALAQVVDIGTTLEGRTIWGIRIGGAGLAPTAPAVVYFGAEHAREWIGATVPQYLAAYLLENYGLVPAVTDLVDHVEWYLIPVFNVDGYVFTWTNDRLWRKNRRDNGNGTIGVDINRNWGYLWGGEGASATPSSLTYRGPTPFSEPETRALRDFFIAHPTVRAQLDIHSYSQLVLWPWGYTATLSPDQPAYADVGLAMKQLIASVHGVTYQAGPIYTAIYPVSGGSVDWTYGERGIFSYSFELRDTGTYGFILPANQIIPNNEEILPAILHLTNSAPVRATQLRFPEHLPANLFVGATTPLSAAITSGVESVDTSTALLHYRFHPQQAFMTLPLTNAGAGLFRAALPATNCSSIPEYYFSVVADQGVVTAPAGAPAEVFTATMLSGAAAYDEPLDSNPGWTTEGQWAWGQPTGGGGVHGEADPRAGHTGLNVYGYNLAGDYPHNLTEQHLTSAATNCAGQYGLRLSFWRWLGVEQAPYDRARLRISNDGVNWTILWENTTAVADAQWVYQEFDIASVADNRATVYLRWSLGPTDNGWAYCGWNIDDVRVFATSCAEKRGDVNCDGQVNFADINPFVLLLSNPEAYAASMPWCPASNGDCSQDGVVSFADINPFVTVLAGGQ